MHKWFLFYFFDQFMFYMEFGASQQSVYQWLACDFSTLYNTERDFLKNIFVQV